MTLSRNKKRINMENWIKERSLSSSTKRLKSKFEVFEIWTESIPFPKNQFGLEKGNWNLDLRIYFQSINDWVRER